MTKSIINLNAPFELGEYKDIQLRVFIPKFAEENGIHLGKEVSLALMVCKRLNDYYTGEFKDKYGVDMQLWFKPTEMEKEKDD